MLVISMSVLESISFVRGENTTITSDKPIIDDPHGPLSTGFLMIWSFECENKSIGIKLELLNKRNFLKYNTSQPYNSVILSPGSNANDSGNYMLKYRSTYYFVFSVDETLNVTDPINIEFDVWGHATLLSLFMGIALGPICFVIFIVALVSFIKWRDKKKIQANAESNQNIDSGSYQEPSFASQEMLFCGQCGAKNKSTQSFCVKCGAELTHELL